MEIRGAVLEESGRPRPYASSRPLSIGALELAGPGPSEILVRVEAASVCHSDLSVVDGTRLRPLPMMLGHEASGVVEAVGDSVTDLTLGQRVVMTFLPRCGYCAGCATGGRLPCERGAASNGAGTLVSGAVRLSRNGEPVLHHLGISGFATHAVVDRTSVVPVDRDVTPQVAALLGCAVLTGGGAVLNAITPRPDDSLGVVGLGGVGIAAVLAALANGCRHLVAVDAVPAKLELARELGAHEVLTPEEALAQGTRADHVVECAGHPRAFELAVAMTAPGGTTVTVGLPAPGAMAQISPLMLTAEARRITGSYQGSAVPARDIPRYVEWWREGRLPLERLISAEIRLDDINEAMDALADGRALRQIIRFK